MAKLSIVSALMEKVPLHNKEGFMMDAAPGSYIMMKYRSKKRASINVREALMAHVVYGNLSIEELDDEIQIMESALYVAPDSSCWLKAHVNTWRDDGGELHLKTRLSPVISRADYSVLISDGELSIDTFERSPYSTTTRGHGRLAAKQMSLVSRLYICGLGDTTTENTYDARIHIGRVV